MDTTPDLARRRIDQAKRTGFQQPNAPGRFLGNWPILVSDDEHTFFCQARSIPETGVVFTCQNELARAQPKSIYGVN